MWDIWACFLFLARSKLRLCSANHRTGYWSNLPCDWPSTALAYLLRARDGKCVLVYHICHRWEYSIGQSDRRDDSLLRVAMIQPDSKVHAANMEPTWGRHDLGGPHVGATWTLLSGHVCMYDIIAQVYRLSAVHCQMTRYSQGVPGYLTRYSVSANEISFDKKISQWGCVF